MFPNLFRGNWLLWGRFWTLFFSRAFFRKKIRVFVRRGVKFVWEKSKNKKNLPKPNLNIPILFRMFLGNLGHPKTYPNSSSSPFYGHFGKFSFSQFVTFGPYICTAKSTGFLGTIHWTAFGPDGYFCDTFWPRPSLLGYLRRLKKFWSKLS